LRASSAAAALAGSAPPIITTSSSRAAGGRALVVGGPGLDACRKIAPCQLPAGAEGSTASCVAQPHLTSDCYTAARPVHQVGGQANYTPAGLRSALHGLVHASRDACVQHESLFRRRPRAPPGRGGPTAFAAPDAGALLRVGSRSSLAPSFPRAGPRPAAKPVDPPATLTSGYQVKNEGGRTRVSSRLWSYSRSGRGRVELRNHRNAVAFRRITVWLDIRDIGVLTSIRPVRESPARLG
jgi:hypothetical protein